MNQDQWVVTCLLVLVFVLFAWGKWRFDFVALIGLLLGVIFKVIPSHQAFTGFSHPAVITVAAVLILSRGLATSGVVDLMNGFLKKFEDSFLLYLTILCCCGACLSAFMNNVGALALLMPVALSGAQKVGRSPAKLLMPLAFSSILGGLTTLIGTPPNIIISSFRQKSLGRPFEMFDFTPVGFVVAGVGVLFICLVGWRLIPSARLGKKNVQALLDIDSYVTEVTIKDDSPLLGYTHDKVKTLAQAMGAEILGLIRKGQRYLVTSKNQRQEKGDILIIEASASDLDRFMTKYKLAISGSDGPLKSKASQKDKTDGEELIEVVVGASSSLAGRIVQDIEFNRRYAVQLLAVSRQGHPYKGRLRSFKIEVGDVLLFRAPYERVSSVIIPFGLMPLAERHLSLGGVKNLYKAITIFLGAIILTSFKVLAAPVAFTLGAVTMVVTKTLSKREFYSAIDWPVIVLLGGMIPLSNAFETTGTAGYLVTTVIGDAPTVGAIVLLTLLLIVTMFLTDIMNNAATSIIMAPIAVSFAKNLEASPDSFLMAIAIGASCSFLTPIGHQNNALILGPGGYKFTDYWRMGLPLEILILLVAVPMILWRWPLFP